MNGEKYINGHARTADMYQVKFLSLRKRLLSNKKKVVLSNFYNFQREAHKCKSQISLSEIPRCFSMLNEFS